MKKLITLYLYFFVGITILSQEKTTETAIEDVITTFFEGLHQGDSAMVQKTIHKEAKIQTTFTNKTGEKVLKTEAKTALLTAIANKNPAHIYLEKLVSIDIKVDGNLASVWTPYEFYLNGKFSHCGANSFQLFNNNGVWQIIYLVDMRRRESCKGFKKRKE